MKVDQNYIELLNHPEWYVKRYQLIKKLGYTCQKCSNDTILNKSDKILINNISLGSQFLHLTTDLYLIRNYYKVEILNKKNKKFNLSFYLDNNSITKYEISELDIYYTQGSFRENTLETENITLIKSPKLNKTLYCRELHVHHKYYQEEKLPWEYPQDALTTLCWSCHDKTHKNEKIKWLDKNGNQKGQLTPCNRCAGTGHFPQYQHVHNGICFECEGFRYKEFHTASKFT